jgi:hypothetical protein
LCNALKDNATLKVLNLNNNFINDDDFQIEIIPEEGL